MGNEKVNGIECIKTKLIKKDGESRLSPVNIEGSNYVIEADYVIIAIGSAVDKNILNNLKLDLNNKGYVKVNEKFETSEKNILAGGDLIGNKATVAWAAKSGRAAAESILENVRRG